MNTEPRKCKCDPGWFGCKGDDCTFGLESSSHECPNGLCHTSADDRDRMRLALRRIADLPTEPRPDGTFNYSRNALIDIARRALNMKEDTDA